MEDKAKAGRKLISQYKKVFGSPEGKAVLYDLMRANHVLSSTYDPTVESHVFLREGQRNAVLRILTILKMNPEMYLKEINEQEGTHV